MSKTLSLATPGDWIAHGEHVISSDCHALVTCMGGRFHPEIYKRVLEREANARLMAASKKMYAYIMKTQFTPMDKLLPELKEIIRDVEGNTTKDEEVNEYA